MASAGRVMAAYEPDAPLDDDGGGGGSDLYSVVSGGGWYAGGSVWGAAGEAPPQDELFWDDYRLALDHYASSGGSRLYGQGGAEPSAVQLGAGEDFGGFSESDFGTPEGGPWGEGGGSPPPAAEGGAGAALGAGAGLLDYVVPVGGRPPPEPGLQAYVVPAAGGLGPDAGPEASLGYMDPAAGGLDHMDPAAGGLDAMDVPAEAGGLQDYMVPAAAGGQDHMDPAAAASPGRPPGS